VSVVVPAETTVVGEAETETVRLWVEDCTVSVVEALLVTGEEALQVAVTVRVILRLLPLLLAAAW
jgi:hypothetical protein